MNKKQFFIFLTCCIVTFLLASPYTWLDFHYFYSQFKLNVGLAQGEIVALPPGPRVLLYPRYFMPAALGWPLSLAGYLGYFWMLFKAIKIKKPEYLMFAAGYPVLYLFVSLPKSQQTWYTLPLIPIHIILASQMLSDLIRVKCE